MKTIGTLAIFILVSALVSSISYAQELTEKERAISYEYYDVDDKQKLSEKYGISVDAIEKIHSRWFSQKPNDQEKIIYTDYTARLANLPKPRKDEDLQKLHKDLADKYGMSFNTIVAITLKGLREDLKSMFDAK